MPDTDKEQIEHNCPKCSHHFLDDCLREHDERVITTTKGKILLAAGLGAVYIVLATFTVHTYALYNGKPGIGIDLQQLLYACLAAVGGIILWAFPKAGTK
jgi:hypothetical protein